MQNTFSPLVSIITPTYNHERFIRDCIQSVLGQTYENWEQIIIDDGSTDSTGKIASGYCDRRIHYVLQNGNGPFELARTYNKAISRANGEIVAILEGDDFWPAEKLATQITAFTDPGVVLAFGECYDVDVSGIPQRRLSHTSRVRQKLRGSIMGNDPIGTATRHMLFMQGRSLISPSTVLIRRSSLDQIGGFQYVAGLPLTDYPTFIELSLLGRFHYSRSIMGFRRRHGRSITVNHAGTIHEKVCEFTFEFLKKHQQAFSLSGDERDALVNDWESSRDKLHFFQARHFLSQKMWTQARKHFRMASKSSSTLVRFAAHVGLLFSYLHRNIELLMALGGRAAFGD